MVLQTQRALPVRPWFAVLLVHVVLIPLVQGQIFRLWNGSSREGLLQLFSGGQWAVVCSKSTAFTQRDAGILCRGLSQPWTNAVVLREEKYLPGNDTFMDLLAVSIDFRCRGNETAFSQCVDETLIKPPANETCYRGIAVMCSNSPIEYKSGPGGTVAKVEVKVNNTWSFICADRFTLADANVTCKSLNQAWTDARPFRLKSTQSLHDLGNVGCDGTQDKLENCPSFVFGQRECETKTDAAVYCAEARERQFRLMNGTSLSSGRVEVRYNNKWGTICGRGQFDDNAAKVVCRSVNQEFKNARVVPIKEYGIGEDLILIGNVSCTGQEQNLFQCKINFDGFHVHYPCTHDDDVAVSCESYRLEGQGDTSHLQVSYDGQWFDVYYDTFDIRAATVACRALGLQRSGAKFIRNMVSDPTGDILSVKKCKGSEETFFDCDHEWRDLAELSQGSTQIARVQLTCGTADSSTLRFRHPGNDFLSVYEVYNGTEWGTICGNGLGEKEARVACRHLELGSSFAAVLPPSYSPKANGSVIMDGITCQGNERSLSDCDYNPLGVVTCDTEHRDDFNIYCGLTEENFHVRLSGGSNNAGRVEVKVYGSWGTVCDDGFDSNAAKVICRQLNLPVSEPRTTSIFPGGEGNVWLHGVNCTGEEENIMDCRFDPLLGPTKCTHEEDIGVVCSGTVVDVDTGITKGGIAGIVIAVLILFAILIVGLCIGIRKWSAARRDLGSNLLKANTGGNRVEYNHDNGVVNMGFNGSPKTGRANASDSKVRLDYHESGGQYNNRRKPGQNHDNNGPDIDDDQNQFPPAYSTLDQYTGPRYDNRSYQEAGFASESAGNEAARNSAEVRPTYKARDIYPQSPRHRNDEDDFGFNSSYRTPSTGTERDYANVGDPTAGTRVKGRQITGQPQGRSRENAYRADEAQNSFGNRRSNGFRGDVYDNRPQGNQPSPTNPDLPSPSYGRLHLPEGTSV